MNNYQQNPDPELDGPYQLAVDLRISGLKYEAIATHPQINVKEHTVRTWFMLGGKCYKAYKDRESLLQEERRAKMKQIEASIQNLASEALKVISDAVVKGNLSASIKVLEMAGLKAVQKVEEIHPQDDEGITLLRQIIEDRRRANRPDSLFNNSPESPYPNF